MDTVAVSRDNSGRKSRQSTRDTALSVHKNSSNILKATMKDAIEKNNSDEPNDSSLPFAIVIQDSAEANEYARSEQNKDIAKDAETQLPVYCFNFDWCKYPVDSIMGIVVLFSSAALWKST
eukprot:5648516-Ditylum_brightwellii.AAC.1